MGLEEREFEAGGASWRSAGDEVATRYLDEKEPTLMNFAKVVRSPESRATVMARVGAQVSKMAA